LEFRGRRDGGVQHGDAAGRGQHWPGCGLGGRVREEGSGGSQCEAAARDGERQGGAAMAGCSRGGAAGAVQVQRLLWRCSAEEGSGFLSCVLGCLGFKKRILFAVLALVYWTRFVELEWSRERLWRLNFSCNVCNI
jgi:hypothetical protein